MRGSRIPGLILAGILVISIAAPAAADSRTPLAGHTPDFARHGHRLGEADPAQTMDVTLWLQPQAGLDALAAAVTDPSSPQFDKFLSPEQVTDQFAPSPATYRQVESYLRAQGLHVTDEAANRMYIAASGTAAQVESAFAVSLGQYQVGGQTVVANDGDPSLPAALAGAVAAVGGLDGAAAAHPNVQPRDSNHPAPHQDALCDGVAPSGTPGYVPCPYTPQTLAAATGLGHVGASGAQQTIAIVDAYGSPTLVPDLGAFDATFGLQGARLRQVGRTTTSNDPNAGVLGWQVETTLDVEWAHAFAPAAPIDLYVAPNANDGPLFRAVDQIVATRAAHLISLSWDDYEAALPTAELHALNEIFAAAAVEGIGVAVAAGDCGDESSAFCGAGVTTVDFPASSPWVTAVGGVSLLPGKPVTPWGSSICVQTQVVDEGLPACPASIFEYGGGGGISSTFAAPIWQAGKTARSLPDISLDADPYTGAWVAFRGQYGAVGGTSLAAPTFTGVMALADQVARRPHGLATPWLYLRGGGAIHDVLARTDSARFAESSGNVDLIGFGSDQGLTAGPGWDDATGLGFPDGAQLINAIK